MMKASVKLTLSLQTMIYFRKSYGFKKLVENLVQVYRKLNEKYKLIYQKLNKLIQICLGNEYNRIIKFLKN